MSRKTENEYSSQNPISETCQFDKVLTMNCFLSILSNKYFMKEKYQWKLIILQCRDWDEYFEKDAHRQSFYVFHYKLKASWILLLCSCRSCRPFSRFLQKNNKENQLRRAQIYHIILRNKTLLRHMSMNMHFHTQQLCSNF